MFSEIVFECVPSSFPAGVDILTRYGSKPNQVVPIETGFLGTLARRLKAGQSSCYDGYSAPHNEGLGLVGST